MEYTLSSGTKVIVQGDMVQYGDSRMRRQTIGVNFANGVRMGGYLSSFGGIFTDEKIGIESGIAASVNAQIGDVREAYEILKAKIGDRTDIDIYELSAIVLETVSEYFGGYLHLDERMSYYYDDDEEESKDNKISNLKGTGAAMCVERAALAQNLLRSLGINTFFKASGIINNGHKEGHCFNIIEFDGKYYIFDTCIPVVINGRINPLVCEIDKETFDLLRCPISEYGISVSTTHYNPYRSIESSITYDSGREKQIEVSALSDEQIKQLS